MEAWCDIWPMGLLEGEGWSIEASVLIGGEGGNALWCCCAEFP